MTKNIILHLHALTACITIGLFVEISRVVYSILGKCCYEYTSEN